MSEIARVTLSGVVTVADVGAIAEAARQELERGIPLVLDVTGLERADVSIVQLAIALARSAREAGIDLSIEGDPAPLVAAGAGSADVAVLLGVV